MQQQNNSWLQVFVCDGSQWGVYYLDCVCEEMTKQFTWAVLFTWIKDYFSGGEFVAADSAFEGDGRKNSTTLGAH